MYVGECFEFIFQVISKNYLLIYLLICRYTHLTHSDNKQQILHIHIDTHIYTHMYMLSMSAVIKCWCDFQDFLFFIIILSCLLNRTNNFYFVGWPHKIFKDPLFDTDFFRFFLRLSLFWLNFDWSKDPTTVNVVNAWTIKVFIGKR